MKSFFLSLFLLCASSVALGQSNHLDLQRTQRNAAGTSAASYFLNECTLQGFMLYNKATEKEICTNWNTDDFETDTVASPNTVRVKGLATAKTNISALQSSVSSALAGMTVFEDDLDDAIDAISDINDGVALMLADIGTMAGDVAALEVAVAAIPSQAQPDWTASSGLAEILHKPDLSGYATTSALTSGLAGKSDTAHAHAGGDITSGTVAAARIDSAMATDSELSSGLSGKLNSPTGTCNSSAYYRGDNTCQSFPSFGVGSVTSVGGTGTVTGLTLTGTVTGSGNLTLGGSIAGLAISQTTGLQTAIDAKAGLPSVAAPSRSLVTATNATGYQISSTRPAMACYEGQTQTTSTIGGPSTGSVFLETADTNSTTPGDWTTVASQTSSQTITLAVVLQSVDGEAWSFCRMIPAAKYVRIRSLTVTGTVSSTINAQQQETLF